MHPLDPSFRCKLPIGLDAPDADAPDAYYRHPDEAIRTNATNGTTIVPSV